MKADIKIDFNMRLWKKETLKLADGLTKDTAKRMVKETRRGLMRHRDITLRRGARGLLGTIRFKKANFKDSRSIGKGYIAGVFKKGQTGKWEDTFGAQAYFLEYGHAAPGLGKYSSYLEGRDDEMAEWMRRRKGRHKTKLYRYKFEEIKKVVEARPFIGPAMRKVTREVKSIHPGMVRDWVSSLNNRSGRGTVWFGRERMR